MNATQNPPVQSLIGRCPVKGCKSVFHLNVPMKAENRYSRGIPGVPGSARPYVAFVPGSKPFWDTIYCATHRRAIYFKTVKGIVNPDHKCDARCMNATGPNCECSCGGENHGGAYNIH